MTITPQIKTSPALVEAEHDAPKALGPVRLLLIEDSSSDALLTQEYVRGVIPDVEFECAVRMGDVTAEAAAEASCAILDLSLPDATGLEALHALRGMSADLPIIVLTGFDDMELGLEAIRHGAEDYLIKNHIDGYTLERAIRYAIERRHLTLELSVQAAAATVAEAMNIVASAAMGSQVGYSIPRTFQGTHQVAVAVDAETVDYLLRCQTCDWEAERGPESLVTWTDRSLDHVLLDHIYYPNQPSRPAPLSPAAQATAAITPADPVTVAFQEPRAAAQEPSEGRAHGPAKAPAPVSRRDLFAVREFFRGDQPEK